MHSQGIEMERKEKVAFEVKKKAYKAPEIKVYGAFSERTKGAGFNGNDADGQTYYGQPLTS